MSKVLKKDKWLSCVFAHKKLEFWNVIINSCEENGMEFKGSVYQPTNNSSMHYKQNPANVLCSQRIANFNKTFQKSYREQPDDLKKFIINEIERECIEKKGASIDQIYQRVLEELLRTDSLNAAKKKGYLRLDSLIEDDRLFIYEPEACLYYVKNQTQEHFNYTQDYFKYKDELNISLKELLKTNKDGLTIDEIHKEIFDIFKDDKKFPVRKDLAVLLSNIAGKNKSTGKWKYNEDANANQSDLNFENVVSKKLLKINSDGFSHSEVIFRLVQIGKYLGFSSWIGKKEQIADNFMDFKFSELSLPTLPIIKIEKSQLDKVQQIDVIWFDKMNLPRYAFEVEESTNIMTGFERFVNILEVNHTLANHLFIIAPKSRQKKLLSVFQTSSYVGHPLYMENKVKFIYKENLVDFYDNNSEKKFTENDFLKLGNAVIVSPF